MRIKLDGLVKSSQTGVTVKSSRCKARKSVKLIVGKYLFVIILGLVFPFRCGAYVMPAEQLIGMMAANFAKFKTLIITQSVKSENQKDKEDIVVGQETIWLKSPDLYYSETNSPPTEQQSDDRVIDILPEGQEIKSLSASSELDIKPENQFIQPRIDMYFRLLLMANKKDKIISLLNEMGINLGRVALTRLNGVIAFRIGDNAPESPKFLIDKERFLPIFVSCRLRADSEDKIVTVNFGDYKRLTEGWYPFEIVYSFTDSDIQKRCSVINLKVNNPIEKPLSKIPGLNAYSVQVFDNYKEESEERRINDIIEALEEKYH